MKATTGEMCNAENQIVVQDCGFLMGRNQMQPYTLTIAGYSYGRVMVSGWGLLR